MLSKRRMRHFEKGSFGVCFFPRLARASVNWTVPGHAQFIQDRATPVGERKSLGKRVTKEAFAEGILHFPSGS